MLNKESEQKIRIFNENLFQKIALNNLEIDKKEKILNILIKKIELKDYSNLDIYDEEGWLDLRRGVLSN